MYLLNGSVLTADSMTLMVVSFSQLLRVLAVSVGTVLHGYTSLLYENESLRVTSRSSYKMYDVSYVQASSSQQAIIVITSFV